MASGGNGYHAANGHANGHAKRFEVPPHPADALPPQNIEAERSVLGAILVDNDVLPGVVDLLRVEDMYRDDHQIIFRAMRDLHLAGKPVDVVTLPDELRRRGEYHRLGGDDAIPEILGSVPHAANALYHAGIVREKSVIRQVIEAANEMIRDGYSNSLTSDAVLEGAERRIAAIAGTVDTLPEVPVPAWPAPPGAAAFHGIAGDLVRLLAPHTEADPASLLVHVLVGYGNLVGRSIYCRVGPSKHHLNLNAVVVGNSAKARKGTGADMVLDAIGDLDPDWRKDRVADGLSSGEGLIAMVADEVRKGDQVIVEGVADKRLLCVESEFGSLLGMLAREGNSLSGVIRKAWDSGRLRTMTKHSPLRSSDAHISIVGHVTFEELRSRLGRTDAHNGFANRFLWACVRRGRLLPEGGSLRPDDLIGVRGLFREAVLWSRQEIQCLVRSPEARALWRSVYRDLSRPKPGLLGAVTSRSEAMVLRLSALYAALDCSPYIAPPHIEAALALWRYCEASAAFLFGGIHDNPDEARILEALRAAGSKGLSRATITASVFQGNMPTDRIAGLLSSLDAAGLISSHECRGRGRPAQIWVAAETCDEGDGT